MLSEFINFTSLSRSDWQSLHHDKVPLLTTAELQTICSLNDQIEGDDVRQIYLPLVKLISIYKKAADDLFFSKQLFLQKNSQQGPFIIGISGSVAVGKSTSSRLLQLLLDRLFPESQVELVTTDGFLYPNAYLEEHNLLHRKGFPESYNMEKLFDFLEVIKHGKSSCVPIYSHEIYDIIPHRFQTVETADFLIIEGINVLQNPLNNGLYITDYYDFSIYIDADTDDIENWYLERFQKLLKLAKNQPSNHYFSFTQLPQEEALGLAKQTWEQINLINLEHYIKPTRHRADLILHKGSDHKIDKILLK